MSTIFLKLRNNILLESDVQLAEREVNNLFSIVTPITKENAATLLSVPVAHIFSNCKDGATIGYSVDGCRVDLFRASVLFSFVQEIWSENPIAGMNPACMCSVDDWICSIPFMAMAELLFFAKDPSIRTAQLITSALAYGESTVADIRKTIERKKTSAPHVHAFHTYKAKFFPRFVRSLVVSNIDPQKEDLTICDPFVGSGTALIESALMGYKAIGIDIDALSCLISEVKCKALEMDERDLQPSPNEGLFAKNASENYQFPKDIVRKFERWNSLDEMEGYQREISSFMDEINAESGAYKELYRIALSDALTRKFNIRMVGTGSGRFALEIGKTSLSSLIKSDLNNEVKAIKAINTLKSLYGITIKKPTVINGDATKRNQKDNSVDIVITSPPYIPASSGREDYLVGKMISLKAMKMYDENTVEKQKEKSVGSMNSGSDVVGDLPESVSQLYHWLLNDELRSIKAKPVLAYYHAIQDSLREDYRTIKDNGTVIYIIGKETVFYNMVTKDILYKVSCDDIFIEIASKIGFKVADKIDIELDKKDNIARPRGSDKYYECAIIMRKT